MSMLKVDLDLIKKYNVAGPRYTSYPPATHFAEEQHPETFLPKLRANNQSDRDLSLYFHLPFCYSLCWYCGCTTVITADQSKSAQYVQYLEREMDLVKGMLNPKRKVVQMHFGGGTPTFSLPDEIRRIGDAIHSRFDFAADAEAGVEVDPRRIGKDHLVALREVGFNRGSLGVQDNDPVVQKAVHRIQPFEMTRQVVEWMREVGFQSINIDLIYGLPYQTPASFAKTIDEMLSLEPDRFAVFNYAHVPWMKPAQKILKPETLPTPGDEAGVAQAHDRAADLRGLCLHRHGPLCADQRRTGGGTAAEDAAAQFPGLQHPGRGGYLRLRHVLDFADGGLLLAEPQGPAGVLREPGPGKIAFAQGLFHDAGGQDPPDDHHAADVRPGAGLRGDVPVAWIEFQGPFCARKSSRWTTWKRTGCCVKTPGGILITDLGRLLVRNIAMRFDAYASTRKENRFSRTI